MKKGLAVSVILLGAVAPGWADKTNDGSGHDPQGRVTREVRHELVMLPYYGGFDDLSYRVDGETVTLMGGVTRPQLKDDAGKAIKDIEDVEGVDNKIEVLPLSPNDDSIRVATYHAIYGDTGLSRYETRAVSPIHIIVRNGLITLKGVVGTEMDKNIAYIRANGVHGAFSVTNELTVGN